MFSQLDSLGHLIFWGTPIFLIICSMLFDEDNIFYVMLGSIVICLLAQILYCSTRESAALAKIFTLMFVGEWFAIIALIFLVLTSIFDDDFPILLVAFLVFAMASSICFLSGEFKTREYKPTIESSFEMIEETEDTPIFYIDSEFANSNIGTALKDFKVIDSGYVDNERVYFYYIKEDDGALVEKYVPTNATRIFLSLNAYEKPFIRTITEKKVINNGEGDEESYENCGIKYQIFLPENFYLPQIEAAY